MFQMPRTFIGVLLLAFICGSFAQQAQQLTSTQTQPTGTGTSSSASASASVQISASSLSDLESQVQQAANSAYASIQSDPSSVETAVQNLATALATAVAGVMVEVLKSGNVDASASAQQIGTVITQALSAGATGQFADLDVSSIVSQVQTVVESTLSSAAADADPAQLTNDVANAAVQALASSLGDLLGVQISSSASVSTTVTPAAIQLAPTGSVDTSQLSAQLLASLQAGDANATVQAFQAALQGNAASTIASVLAQAAGDSTLQANLVAFLAAAFGTPGFPGFGLVTALQSAASLPGGDNLQSVLSQAISQANSAGDTPTLSTMLSFLVISKQSGLDLFLNAISDSIESGGCDSVALVLGNTNKQAISNGAGPQFQNSLKSVSEINKCLQVGISLSVTVGILQNIQQNPQAAVKLIVDAANNKQPQAIADAITGAVQSGDTDALTTVITNVLSTPDIPIDQLTLAFTIAMQSTTPGVQSQVTTILSQPSVQQTFSAMISYAFDKTSRTPNTTDSFVQIIGGSVSGDSCALQPAVESALESASSPQDILNVILEVLLGEYCVLLFFLGCLRQ
eukprot:TRINITY_DN674_c0_g1_i8.p1 TRINITY_DN674_c0_g1~~TRINITY_DN674_c0_g1_i8.p1  ORF type:complete len:573 (-),score=85.20 TRINITY_DN674_c0_g1_i8:13-1731(-)